jgi:hypothetical protein
MRIFLLAVLGLLLGACDQTTQSGGSPNMTASTATTNADLPPIYEPLIDMHRVNPDKYRRDLAACREQAAPQEAAAVAGAIASFIPVSTYGLARNLANATDAAQNVGGSVAASGAAAGDAATADYALVVNTCLAHKKYRLLRG